MNKTQLELGISSKERLLPGHILFYCGVLVCCSAGFIGVFFSQLEVVKSGSTISDFFVLLSCIDFFILESLVILLLGVVFLNCNWILRCSTYLLTTLFIFITGLQLAIFYQGHEFISRLAIENINHVSLLINSSSIIVLFILLSLSLLLIIGSEKIIRVAGGSKVTVYPIVGLISLLTFFSFWQFFIPSKIVTQRDIFLKENFIEHTSPFLSLYKVLVSKKKFIPDSFTDLELDKIQEMGFHFDPDHEYSFKKDKFYQEDPPFQKKIGTSGKSNVIVFFAEGLSARSLNLYGAPYPGLTPNIDNFSKRAMVIQNYYNHTAATYRGLLGQLCSIYPSIGGAGGWKSKYKKTPGSNYLSLANIFNYNGYQTVFLDSHDKDRAYVDDLMIKIGFTKVVTGVQLARKYLGGAHLSKKESLSDKQFMQSLVGYLKKKETDDLGEKPFFMCLYNLGTHAFNKVSQDGIKYKNSKNQSLNTIHNFDYAFGEFWEYFKNSSFADNTIIIFTADHSHYPEKAFIEAFKSTEYQKMFIDKIPFIIYDPTRDLPPYFDAKNSTSIDFAPSMLHYLKFPNHENSFLGQSLFSENSKQMKNAGVASFGEEVYLIIDSQIHKSGYSQDYKKELLLISKLIKHSQNLELSGKLWNEKLNKNVMKAIEH